MTAKTLPVDTFDLVIFGGTGDLALRKLLPGLLRRYADGQIPEDSRILVCGNPQMLDDVRDALFARGLRPDRSAVPGHFATENYW